MLENKYMWRPTCYVAIDAETSPWCKSKASTQILLVCILSAKNMQFQSFLSLRYFLAFKMDYCSMHLSNLPLTFLNECPMNVHPMDRQGMWYWFFFFFKLFVLQVLGNSHSFFTLYICLTKSSLPPFYILYSAFKLSPILLSLRSVPGGILALD